MGLVEVQKQLAKLKRKDKSKRERSMIMPDRPDPPVLKKVTIPLSPQANTATIFAANTKTIVASSFENLSEPTTVQLRSLDDKTPKDAPLSTFFKRLLVGLIVFGGLCVVAIVGLAIAFPEQTTAQKDAVALLTHLATLIFGMVVGLFTAKQL